MPELWVWLAYMSIGVVAGISAGLFGVGGGLIVVPALAIIFQQINIQPTNLMHIAVGTSLAVIVVTSLSSVREHNKQGAILWTVFKKFTPAIIVGTLAGAFLASRLASDYLKVVFGVVEILIALQLYFNFKPEAQRKLPDWPGLSFVGFTIGFISTIVGIGGGTMTGPFLNWCNVKIHNAVATSAACGVPIAIIGSLSYFAFGLKQQPSDFFASGFIYWPAFIGIAFTSMLAAPFGARLAHRLPTQHLKRYFALFLLFVGIGMLVY